MIPVLSLLPNPVVGKDERINSDTLLFSCPYGLVNPLPNSSPPVFRTGVFLNVGVIDVRYDGPPPSLRSLQTLKTFINSHLESVATFLHLPRNLHVGTGRILKEILFLI